MVSHSCWHRGVDRRENSDTLMSSLAEQNFVFWPPDSQAKDLPDERRWSGNYFGSPSQPTSCTARANLRWLAGESSRPRDTSSAGCNQVLVGFGYDRAARWGETQNLGVQPVLSKAGERIRTVDIHVGNVTLYR